ncbi:hypothetical protein WR25_21833 [Diploscapter pachys]|uniref:Nuclear respiratory factor 1 NLS/DNA-binding dimerisation domain-containing protein n=1 Tax=Diploscapter pachys TaxID=2018661 RepID=A0A2A2LI07_9BILA|nr:hypothetical protein WR25_21833 [Diploscapter pachys]
MEDGSRTSQEHFNENLKTGPKRSFYRAFKRAESNQTIMARDRTRLIEKIQELVAELNEKCDEHYALIISDPKPSTHFSVLGSELMVQSVMESNIVDVVGRKQKKSDRDQKEKETIYFPYVFPLMDISLSETLGMSEPQLFYFMCLAMDSFNFPHKQHYKSKQKPLFWPHSMRFAAIRSTPLEQLSEYKDIDPIRSKKEALKRVLISMRKYYGKMLDELYGNGEIRQRSGSVNIEQPIRVQLYQKLGLGENESDSTIVQNEEVEEKFDPKSLNLVSEGGNRRNGNETENGQARQNCKEDEKMAENCGFEKGKKDLGNTYDSYIEYLKSNGAIMEFDDCFSNGPGQFDFERVFAQKKEHGKRLRLEYSESERSDNATLLGGSETLPDTDRENRNTTTNGIIRPKPMRRVILNGEKKLTREVKED